MRTNLVFWRLTLLLTAGRAQQVDPWKVKIGMKVKAVWKAEKERKWAITDIKY